MTATKEVLPLTAVVFTESSIAIYGVSFLFCRYGLFLLCNELGKEIKAPCDFSLFVL